MAGKYEIKDAKGGKFHFSLKAGNGQIILSSEMYETKKAAEKGVESVRKNGGNEKRFEKKASTKKQPYFVLKANNGEPIGKSEMYNTEASRDKGMASVMKNAPEARVVDLTTAPAPKK
jgi:uncharacterized protein YegP (UPF0339 family)